MGEITVVIPTRNEEENIIQLLDDLAEQTMFKQIKEIIVSDNESTDNTRKLIKNWKGDIPIRIIEGGIPSIARNRGALEATTQYIAFFDADVRIYNKHLIMDCLKKMSKGYHLLTAKIGCKESKKANAAYKLNNQLTKMSKYHKPFATGMFMFWLKEEFDRLGGFNEEIHFAEDYNLSKQVKPSKFKVLKTTLYTGNRRFDITGYQNLVKMMLTAFVNQGDIEKLSGDKGYWDHLD